MKASERQRESMIARILACLETCGPSSTQTIARLTQLSKTAVGNTIGNLWRRGWVREHGVAASGAPIWAYTGKIWLGIGHYRQDHAASDASGDAEHLAWMAYWSERHRERLRRQRQNPPGEAPCRSTCNV